MKKVFLFIALLVSFLSCRKDIKNLKKDISGTWEIEKNINYSGIINYAPGNGNTIVLSSNGSFERFENGSSVFKGSYTLKRKEDCQSREDDILFSTNEPNSTAFYTRIENEELIFNTPNCYADGNTAYYVKLY